MDFKDQRNKLIEAMKKSGALRTASIVQAFKKVPREDFVPESSETHSYKDGPLPIGEGQTISQPSTVAIMTEALEPEPTSKILEVGTGSGYQAAILSHLCKIVITLERIPFLYDFGKKNLKEYENVEAHLEDGTRGYPNHSPFDRIIVAAEAKRVPAALFAQLREEGILVIPVKGKLLKVQKVNDEQEITDLGHFAFVPLVGDH